MPFEILGEITEIETIAMGKAIHDLRRLEKLYGKARWRKMKGVALLSIAKYSDISTGLESLTNGHPENQRRHYNM